MGVGASGRPSGDRAVGQWAGECALAGHGDPPQGSGEAHRAPPTDHHCPTRHPTLSKRWGRIFMNLGAWIFGVPRQRPRDPEDRT